MNIILLTDKDRINDKHYRLSDKRFEHIINILGAEEKNRVEIGLLNGPTGSAVISSIKKNYLELQIDELNATWLPQYEIDLVCALPRPQTLKKILPTIATYGVRKLHLIRANRVEKSYFQSPLTKPDKQLPYLFEGLSQGKITRLPEVIVHNKFKPFFEKYLPDSEEKEEALRIVAHPGTDKTFHELIKKPNKRLIVAIGPEGGWVPFELDLMQEKGFTSVNISDYVLRVETAVNTSLAQIELVNKIIF